MHPDVDSRYAWFRLAVSLALITIGGSGMYVVVVVLPTVQAEFGIARATASIPYTVLLVGFGIGGILMGRLADRYGVVVPVRIGAIALGVGFGLAALSPNILVFSIVHGLLLGLLGSAATLSPLMADTSFWFLRRRGIAVALCAAGNYLAGVVWPPIIQSLTSQYGWRTAYVVAGVACVVLMLPLAQFLRRPRPGVGGAIAAESAGAAADAGAAQRAGHPGEADVGVAATLVVPPATVAPIPRLVSDERPLGMSPAALQTLLCIAGIACCVAMSMPQVHIVAYCADLGYGPARGAQMLSLMLAFGIVSRIVSGIICDRIGGLRTLLLGSLLQGIALLLFLPFDSMVSLYVVSALFGLSQGGIVPAYAIIVREHFSPAQAAERIGTVLTATLLGMALGGWLSGAIFDFTGSYDAAFLNGIAWNVLNAGIVMFLLMRSGQTLFGRPTVPQFAAR